jgi:hypothetical protein
MQLADHTKEGHLEFAKIWERPVLLLANLIWEHQEQHIGALREKQSAVVVLLGLQQILDHSTLLILRALFKVHYCCH